MTQLLPRQSPVVPDEPSTTVWGLSVQDLHDAYWRGRGIQCVRPNAVGNIDRAADLFMLLEPGQLVLFDLSQLINRLVWHGAAITFVQVVDVIGPDYREHLVMDADGYIERIARQYGPMRRSRFRGGRALLTDRHRMARIWTGAADASEAHRELRFAVTRSCIDRVRTPGRHFNLDFCDERRQFVLELVERWGDPGSVIDGIVEIAPSVWKRTGEPDPAGAVMVGPAWIGGGYADDDFDGTPLIGPVVRYDRADYEAGSRHRPATVRPLIEIDSKDAPAPVPFPPGRRLYYHVKRGFDACVSAIALVSLAPLFGLIALAVLLDNGGPVLFRHRRQTLGGRRFECLKFRTMRRNAEEMVPTLAGRNLCDGPQVYIRNDPRVTRIGCVLRRFHLDELPQLWNVLRGEMSLVGPRPSPDRENQFCPAWRELRLSVRPGMTGLWQLNRTRSPGRDFQEWIQYDIEYVRRAGFWLDIRICLRTALHLLFRRSGS